MRCPACWEPRSWVAERCPKCTTWHNLLYMWLYNFAVAMLTVVLLFMLLGLVGWLLF